MNSDEKISVSGLHFTVLGGDSRQTHPISPSTTYRLYRLFTFPKGRRIGQADFASLARLPSNQLSCCKLKRGEAERSVQPTFPLGCQPCQSCPLDLVIVCHVFWPVLMLFGACFLLGMRSKKMRSFDEDHR